MRLLDKLRKLMYGRYGTDDLNQFLLILYIVLLIIDLFINTLLLEILELIIIIVIFYRTFSKKIYKRKKENDKYLEFKKNIFKPFKNIKRNYKDRDNYIYKKCHNCKKTLRLPLPNSRGIKHIKCPNCHKRIRILVLRKQKIEIIKGSV